MGVWAGLRRRRENVPRILAEVVLIVAAAASGVLWLTASNFNYEAWAALFVILGGGTELLRRRVGKDY
jgi:hypothetical protein